MEPKSTPSRLSKIISKNIQKFQLFLEKNKTFFSSENSADEESPDSPDSFSNKTDLGKYGSLDKVGELEIGPFRTPPLPRRRFPGDFSKKSPELKDRKKAAEAPV